VNNYNARRIGGGHTDLPQPSSSGAASGRSLLAPPNTASRAKNVGHDQACRGKITDQNPNASKNKRRIASRPRPLAAQASHRFQVRA